MKLDLLPGALRVSEETQAGRLMLHLLRPPFGVWILRVGVESFKSLATCSSSWLRRVRLAWEQKSESVKLSGR